MVLISFLTDHLIDKLTGCRDYDCDPGERQQRRGVFEAGYFDTQRTDGLRLKLGS